MAREGRIPRRWRVVIWIVGSIAAAAVIVLVALTLSSPSADLPLNLPTRPIPQDWASPEPPGAEAPATTAKEAYVTAGRLALLGNGRPFGEEIYDLRIAEDGATLTSSGRFWFKVVFATIQVSFEQTLDADGDLRPVAYTADFHAPLGLDRSLRATVLADRMTVARSGEEEEIRIKPERTFTLGTFSTYVLLPRLYALRHQSGSASFEVLLFGGPPSRATEPATGELPTMTVERAGSASLRAGGIAIEVDRYLVRSTIGESELFARGDEFLALRARGEDETLLVYRSDFFPDGIEIVD